MVNVDISNVWGAVSLPELLGREREVFDAHQNDSDLLLVCGVTEAALGARGAIDLYGGAKRNLLHSPQVYFVGGSLSSRQWLELSSLLEERDYSLLLVSPTGQDLGVNVTARGLRWMMERKYGAAAKNRIFVATKVGTPLHRMGQEEGYELFPLPRELGGAGSVFSAGGLIPMAVAGIDPLAVVEGAVEQYEAADIRSFENPAWLYAAARSVLSSKGRDREILCCFDHSLASLGRWWQRVTWMWQDQSTMLTPETALLPGDLTGLEALTRTGRVFETALHFAPIAKKVPVEMDWKDYDGLGFLSGRTWEDVERHAAEALVYTHTLAGTPLIDLDAGELTAEAVGGLFAFLELSSALTALLCGGDPFTPVTGPAVPAALNRLRDGEM